MCQTLRRASSLARENSPASKIAAQAYIARSPSESPLQDIIYLILLLFNFLTISEAFLHPQPPTFFALYSMKIPLHPLPVFRGLSSRRQPALAGHARCSAEPSTACQGPPEGSTGTCFSKSGVHTWLSVLWVFLPNIPFRMSPLY